MSAVMEFKSLLSTSTRGVSEVAAAAAAEEATLSAVVSFVVDVVVVDVVVVVVVVIRRRRRRRRRHRRRRRCVSYFTARRIQLPLEGPALLGVPGVPAPPTVRWARPCPAGPYTLEAPIRTECSTCKMEFAVPLLHSAGPAAG